MHVKEIKYSDEIVLLMLEEFNTYIELFLESRAVLVTLKNHTIIQLKIQPYQMNL